MKSIWSTIALIVGLTILAGYGYATQRGIIVGSPKKEFVPSEMRKAPGGYRSFHFWHAGYGGYRGGK
jgi:hypothetical protein